MNISLLYPIVNVVVTAIFAGMVLRQYLQRHRPYQLYWAIGLLMAFVATLAYVLMAIVEPTSGAGIVLFRIYYILGGALVAAWLGLGSIALVTSALATRISLITLCVLSVLAIVLIAIAGINLPQLRQVVGTSGTGILQPGAWLPTIIILNSLGALAVGGVAIYSGWKLLRRQPNVAGFRTGNLLWVNVLILLGVVLISLAGSGARISTGSIAQFFNTQGGFWLLMALGWVVFFSGVVLASRRSVSKTPAVQDERPGRRQAHAPTNPAGRG